MSVRASALRLAAGIRACRLAACACAVAAALAAEAVPPPVAATLEALREAEPAVALAIIAKHPGPAHPLIDLAAAQAHLALADAGGGAGHAAEAERLAKAALAADPGRRAAHLVLARLAAAREDWVAASRSAAAGIDTAVDDAARLGFLADVARRAGDHRLAALAVQAGILRFPGDARLRRIDLALCIDAGQPAQAAAIVRGLLAADPGDAELWRQLAWCAQELGRPDDVRIAIEAALLAKEDPGLRRQLAELQAGSQPQAALATIAPLLDGRRPDGGPVQPDEATALAAARIAGLAGDPARGRRWLSGRTGRDARLADARLAVQQGDEAGAGAALDALIAAGEADPQVLTWAGSLAERLDQAPRAEALYQQAAAAGHAPAGLRLAALCLRQGRRDEAATLIATHLAQHPDDAQAKALQAALARPAAR